MNNAKIYIEQMNVVDNFDVSKPRELGGEIAEIKHVNMTKANAIKNLLRQYMEEKLGKLSIKIE